MRAVLLACNPPSDAGSGDHPAALRPVLDRPALQHAVELVVRHGIRRIEVVTGAAPEAVSALLGDGRRWGCAIHYHLSRHDDRPTQAIQRAIGDAHTVLLGRADHLADLPAPDEPDSGRPLTFVTGSVDEPMAWAGWAWVPARHARVLPPNLRLDALGGNLIEAAERSGRLRAVAEVLSTDALPAWLRAQARALEGAMPVLRVDGLERAAGIRVGHGARVHPSATLVAPVLVAAHARIEAGARIGPYAVVGEGAIVDCESSVAHGAVLPRTYVGEGLELEHAVADGAGLWSLRHGTRVAVPDRQLLGAVSVDGWLTQAAVRALAGVAWAVTAPLSALAQAVAASERPQAAAPSPTLADLCARVLPGLRHVAAGRLRLVGEVREMGADAGLVAASQVMCGPDATDEERWSADAVHHATPSLAGDLRVFAAYVGRALRPRVSVPGVR